MLQTFAPLNFVEFYITNTCNLSCTGCNRFNNLNLRGHEDWQKHKAVYHKFSQYVDVDKVHILGGEPLQHPDIINILTDLRTFFPTQKITIYTNGLLLDTIPKLKLAILKNKIQLNVNCHNKKWRKKLYQKLEKLFGEKIILQWNMPSKDEAKYSASFVTSNDIKHVFNVSEYFYQNSFNHPLELKPHESDPALAWKVCYSKCPTLAEGKFYKCPISHCMPVALRQRNDIVLSDKQRELVNTFPYIECADIDKVSQKHLDEFLWEMIGQCSLCPQQWNPQRIRQLKVN